MEKFRLSDISKRIREFRLPTTKFKIRSTMIILVLVTMAIFLFGGGLYDIVNSPLSNPGMSSGEIQAYMDAVYDSISLMLFQVIGVGGGFLAYRSTRYAYRPREARMFLLIGVTLLFIGFTGAELLLLMKGA